MRQIIEGMSEETPEPRSARRGRPGYDQEQMLEVIVQVFNDRGYDAATLENIAKRLGLSKSAVYHHFTSKAEMLELALNQVLGALEEVFADRQATHGEAQDRISFVVRGAVQVACERQPYLKLLLRLNGNSEVELNAMERRRLIDARMREMFVLARSEHTLSDNFDPGLAARYTFGMVNSVVEWYRPNGKFTPEQLADTLLQMLAGGLGTEAVRVTGTIA